MIAPYARYIPLAEDIPSGDPDAPPGFQTGMTTLMNWGSWIVMAICGIAVLVCAGRMAMAHKSGADGGQHMVGLIWVIVAAVLAGSGAAIVNGVVAKE